MWYLEASIKNLLAQTDLDDTTLEQFRAYLLGAYGVSRWAEIPTGRLTQINDRLRALPVEERRETISSKAGGIADAA